MAPAVHVELELTRQLITLVTATMTKMKGNHKPTGQCYRLNPNYDNYTIGIGILRVYRVQAQ